MSPVQQAKELRGDQFRDELEAHLLGGIVVSTPSLFLMARICPKGADVSDVWSTWDDGGAYFIWLAVGDPARMFDFMPEFRPWIGFHREGRGWTDNRWYPTEFLRTRLSRMLTRTNVLEITSAC